MRVDIKDAHYGNYDIKRIYYGNNLVLNKFDDNQNVYVFDLSKVTNNLTLVLKGEVVTDWGDGTIDSNLTHTYSIQSIYTVKTRQSILTGNGLGDNNTRNSLVKIINIDNTLTNGWRQYYYCANLSIINSSAPPNLNNCGQMFIGCTQLTTISQSFVNLMEDVKNGANTTCNAYTGCFNGCTNIINPQTYTTLSGLYPTWF